MTTKIEEMSDAELEAIAAQEESSPEAAPAKAQEVSPELSGGEAALALTSKLSMGLGPTVAGLSAATVNYLADGGSLAESKAIFDMARDDYNDTVAQAEKQYPTIAKAVNAAEFIQKAIPSSQAANFGISIAEQVGQEGITPEAIAKGAGYAAMGAVGGRALTAMTKAGGVIGQHIGTGIEKAPEYISKWGEAVNLSSAMEKLGVVTSGAKTALFNTLTSRGLDPDTFVKKLSEYELNGAPIFQGTVGQMRAAAKDKIKQLGTELGEHMILLDSAATPNIPASNFNRAMASTVDMLSDTPVQKEIDLVNRIKDKMLGLQEKGVLNLKDVHNFKEFIGKSINWEDLSAKNMNARLEKLYFESSDYLKNAIDDIPIEPDLKYIYNAASEEYSNLMSLNRVISKEPGREFAKLAQTGDLSNKIKNFLSAPSQNIASITSDALLEPMQKFGLTKVLTGFAGGMEHLSPYITKITEGLARDPDILNDLLAPAESAVDLTMSPVQRNTEDLLRKDAHIYNIIKEADPVLATKFNNALKDEQYDVVAELMSGMSNIPKMKRFIEPGIGWDGKVTNEVEKSIVKDRILTADLSVIQQMQQIKELEKSGTIPAAQPKIELRQLAKMPLRSSDGRKKQEY